MHRVLPGPQLAFDRVVVKRLARLDVGQLRHRALDVGIALGETPVRNRHPLPGLNLEHESRPIRIVRLHQTGGHARIGVAPPPVFCSERVDHLGCARRARRSTESVDDDSKKCILGQAEHAFELDGIDRVKRREHVTHADSRAGFFSPHLHIVEPIEAHEVRDRFAHVLRIKGGTSTRSRSARR